MVVRLLFISLCVSAAAMAAAAERSIDRDALRRIVQDECAVHWRNDLRPAPCEQVSIPRAHEAQGYAVLADIKGGAHFLLIPTQTITGIESPALLAPHAANYFAAAWRARNYLAQAVAHPLARGAVGLAVNPQHARTQDQLHIHMECLGPVVQRALQDAQRHLKSTWSPLDVGGATYHARRVMGTDLEKTNPFALVAQMPGARSDMGAYTLLVAGMQFRDGPGFIVLTGRNTPGAELFLDSTCAVAAASHR